MNAVIEEDFQRSLELLPEVFDLLLERDGNEIQDDTFLEKFMSWLGESLEDRGMNCVLLEWSVSLFDWIYVCLSLCLLVFWSSIFCKRSDR